ncbi:hypothetical protein [Pyxidicoccus caerfyrddinensis]|uniref:hypothetical protein n=1 Tax=Pyxidicoccus caerfyrddinensis TaxID=2709663 RepID=UPI0013D989D6|nr:hypothetical protein [Pyxidicoccus caerfyrddinensis]
MKRVMIAMCAATTLLVGCGVDNEDAEVATAEVDTVTQPILLGTTIDQCSSVLKVLNSSGSYVTIPRGTTTRVYVSDNRFRWLCGSSTEYTTCDVGTTYVDVYHSTTSRQITWYCKA